MTVTGLQVIGLNWDGLDLQSANLDLMFTIDEGLDNLPVMRGNDQVLPFRTGRLPAQQVADRRAIVASGWIAGSGSLPRASYRAYLDQLKLHLDPAKGPRILVATLEDGSTRWAIARASNLIPGDGIGGEFAAMSIQWDAPDPYWYGATGIAMDSGYLMDTGAVMDSGEEIIVAPTSASHEVEIDTRGTANVERVRVTFIGPTLVGFGIENLSTEELVGCAFLGVLAAPPTPATLVVDNFARTAVLNDTNVRGSMVLRDGNRHGEYLYLLPGINRLRITGQPAECRISFQPTYL